MGVKETSLAHPALLALTRADGGLPSSKYPGTTRLGLDGHSSVVSQPISHEAEQFQSRLSTLLPAAAPHYRLIPDGTRHGVQCLTLGIWHFDHFD